MGLKITPTFASSCQDDTAFENEIRTAMCDVCSEMRPSKKTLNIVMQFAANYECFNTRVGRFDMILN